MTLPLEKSQNFILHGYVDECLRDMLIDYEQAFGGLLRQERSVLQISPVRSFDLLRALGNADLIPRVHKPRPASPETLGPLEGFSLLHSASRAMDGVALGRKIEFHQWLQNVRQGEFFPTFYFPSNAAGPDIVFCLQHQEDRTKRILCALQVNRILSRFLICRKS